MTFAQMMAHIKARTDLEAVLAHVTDLDVDDYCNPDRYEIYMAKLLAVADAALAIQGNETAHMIASKCLARALFCSAYDDTDIEYQ